jgi:hypothetical protein
MGCTSAKPKRTISIEDVAQKKEVVTQPDKNGQINKPTPDKSQPTKKTTNGSNDVSNAIQIPGANKSFLAPDGIPFIDEDIESEVEERVAVQAETDSHNKVQQQDQNKNVMVSVHKDAPKPAQPQTHPKQPERVEPTATHSSALPANSQPTNAEREDAELRIAPAPTGQVTVQSVATTDEKSHSDVRTPSQCDSKKTEKEQQAATKIQAGIRGFLDRKKVKAIKQEKEHLPTSVTVTSDNQNEQKGKVKLHREEHIEEDTTDGAPEHEKEVIAATKIQANYKGYKTRKMLKTKNNDKK